MTRPFVERITLSTNISTVRVPAGVLRGNGRLEAVPVGRSITSFGASAGVPVLWNVKELRF